MTPTAATRVFALLGDPVSHSLSPALQNAAFRAAGVDGVYVALRSETDAVAGIVTALARAGGGGNVTVPHKRVAAGAVERPTDAVLRTGACNTFWAEAGRVHGDNTDVAGALGAVEVLLGGTPRGASVLLLGAGGAAAAVACALSGAGADRIVVANRTPARAAALVARFPGLRLADPDALDGDAFDLAVNATALGLRPADPLPLDPERGPRVGAALDLVYAPGETAWVRRMRAVGVPAADGTEMLLLQGAAAFRRWWRTEPSLAAMRAALPASAVPSSGHTPLPDRPCPS